MQQELPSNDQNQISSTISARNLVQGYLSRDVARKSKDRNCLLLVVIACLLVVILALSVNEFQKYQVKTKAAAIPVEKQTKQPPSANSQHSSGHGRPQAQSHVKSQPSATTSPSKPEISIPSSISAPILKSNFAEAISYRSQLIERIDASYNQYECIEMDPLFHKFHYDSKTMYFQTYDEVLMPSCLNEQNYKWSVSRENIRVWNKERQVTEWAYNNVQEGDRILYYRPNTNNLAQLFVLSRLIGPDAQILVLGDNRARQCIGDIMNLYTAKNNIRFIETNQLRNNKDYSVIIANQDVFELSDNSGKIIEHPESFSKILLYAKDTSKLTVTFPALKIQRVKLEQKPCGRGIFQENLSGEGFYSLTPKQFHLTRRVLKREAPPANSPLSTFSLEADYKQSKVEYKNRLITQRQTLKGYESQGLCIDLKSPRKQSNFVFTIYGHRLYDVTAEQVLQWEEERQAIEWIRKNSPKSNVYYEMKHSFNLVAIVQIAFLLKDTTLFVVCSTDQCPKIERQLTQNKLSNVKLLKESNSKEALASAKIISDNEVLLKDCLGKEFLKKGSMLGHFNNKRNESVEAIRQIYVHHNVRELIMPQPKQECVDYQYLHYFWNSYHPNGYYEISLSDYTVYVFWGGPPEKINQRKKFLIEELIRGTVEIKMISPETFLYFQIPGTPIHKAYFLLTSIQKSDYVRVYLMHHYGGGYGDVKHTHFDWRFHFDKIYKDEKILATGFAQHGRDGACAEHEGPPSCWEVQSQSHRMMGNTHYIFKKNSVVTKEWFDMVTKNLENKYEELKRNPPQVPREYRGGHFTRKDGSSFVSQYPFSWSEIANQKLGRVQYRHLDNIDASMPYQINVDYRTSSIHDEN